MNSGSAFVQSCRLLADTVFSTANSFIHFYWGLYIFQLIKLFLLLSTKYSRSSGPDVKFKCTFRAGKTKLLQSDPWKVRVHKEGVLKSKKPCDVMSSKKKPRKPKRTKPKTLWFDMKLKLRKVH